MPVVTSIIVGNLDGVHRGHLQLLSTAGAAAGPGGRVLVLAFDPHPLEVLCPEAAPARLTTFEHRAELLRAAGASEVRRLEPTPELLGLDAEAFIARLVREHEPDCIVEGPDFRFGRGRAGSVRTLQALADRYAYRVVISDLVEVTLADRSVVVAGSTIIRWLLQQGRVRDAATALSRPYELRGRVTRGDRRGREIGMPTANLDPAGCLLPADGIYAGRAIRPDGACFAAAISVGTKPSFGVHPRTCEAHLVGYDGPLDDYDWVLRLQFLAWLRDQVAYRDVEALLAQMRRDVEQTAVLATAP